MTLVGFKRATIGILDADGNVIEEHVVEGKQDEGATTTADISGLSATPVRVHGSDIVYYVSQRGTGDVVVNLGLLDLPDTFSDKLLGYVVATSGITFVGKDTEPPYVALMLESSNLKGDTALLAFFKGKMSKESVTLNTLGEGDYTPEAETFVFNAIEDDKDGESSGNVLGKYVGSDTVTIDALKALVLPPVVAG